MGRWSQRGACADPGEAVKLRPTGCVEGQDVEDGDRSRDSARLWARAAGRVEMSGVRWEKPIVELTGESILLLNLTGEGLETASPRCPTLSSSAGKSSMP